MGDTLVYVVMGNVAHEGNTVLGVFTAPERAIAWVRSEGTRLMGGGFASEYDSVSIEVWALDGERRGEAGPSLYMEADPATDAALLARLAQTGGA